MHSLRVTEPSELAQARRAIASMASDHGFNVQDTARAALVATEICSNIIKHGGGGELLAGPLHEGQSNGLGLLGLDQGPGMQDVPRCRRDGYSTGGSPGTGLGAIERLSQRFDIYSKPRKGTAVMAHLWPSSHRRPHGTLEVGAVVVPKPGEVLSGDTWSHLEYDGGAVLLCADGLGHGLGAAQAANLACTTFETSTRQRPAALLSLIHQALRTTRGAAVSLIQIDWFLRQVTTASVGNLSAALVNDIAIKRLPSDNGIVGHILPRLRELSFPCDIGTVLIVHSDGIGTNWQPERYPELLRHHPALIAGVLYRDCKRGRDDAMVVVIKQATQ